MIVDLAAKDVVYTNLFTGVAGNYLSKSVEKAGLDPNDLPSADKSAMNFGSGGNTRPRRGGISGARGRGSATSPTPGRLQT